ncbi:MAG: glycosyltransferase [Clostridia bacterium]|nr:glycosyltransferase [Clostridia bacterium]
MKIFISLSDTCVGGVTTAAVNLANELVSRGHKVFFLDMSRENACADRLRDGVKLPALKGKSRLWNIGLENIKQARGLKKLGILALGFIKKLTIRSGLWYKLIFSKFNKGESFDVAIAFRQCAPCYSFVLNKVNAKRKMGFVHGELTYMGDISSWKKYMPSFDKIAYVSNAVREQFVAKYPELDKNACTVYNTFDVEQIKRLAEDECDLFFDESKVNIVTVARIDNAFKQTQWIVEICKRLKNETDTPFHWYVVGNGPDFDKTLALSKEQETDDVLTFVGNKNNPYTYIKQSDFTVLTSKSESYGLVVVESLILQRPVVVAEYPAVYEIIEDGKHGLIAKQNVDSISDCVCKMIDDRDGIRDKCEAYLAALMINNDTAYSQFLKAVE